MTKTNLVHDLIVKYLDEKTLLTVLKSKSRLTRSAFYRVRNLKLDDSLIISSLPQFKSHCRGNNVIRLAFLINKYSNSEIIEVYWNGKKFRIYKITLWNAGLRGGCEGAHRELVNLMIAKGARDWYQGLRAACRGGDREIVDLMINQGANNWNEGLYGACEGGHPKLVNLMIAKGATGFDGGLRKACFGGYICYENMEYVSGTRKRLHAYQEIVDLMISKGVKDLNGGLDYACRGGHREIVDQMIDQMINQGVAVDWNSGLFGACFGRYRIIRLTGDEIRGACWRDSTSRPLRGVCVRKRIYQELINLMIAKGATVCGYCRKSIEKHLR